MKKLILIFSAIVIAAVHSYGKEQFIYTQISRNEGLTSTVNCIYKETDGDVWLGSPNGLYRFNGYDLRHYEDSLLKGRRVFQISKDHEGTFWVTTDCWAMMRKPGEDAFIHVKAEDMEEREALNSLLADEEGVWFGGNGKIFRYTYADRRFFLFKEMTEKPSFICRQMCRLDESTLLCSSHNGMILLDTATGNITDAPYETFNEVSATLIDSRGRIWVAFYNRGIHVFDRNGNTLKRYRSSGSDLSSDVVLCMTEKDSRIWAGTDGGGINIIDPETDRISVLSHVAGDPSSLPAHSIKSIYTDSHGNIWAGSIRDGLIRISRSGMKTYSDSHIGMPTGLSNPTVLCLYQEERSGDIWIGTDGEGINRFDPQTNTFTHYPKTLNMKVVSIASYSQDELALSVYGDRIWLFNLHTGNIRPFHIEDNNINYTLKYAGRSLNLANEKEGDLLLIGNTVSRLDKNTGKCTLITTEDGRKAEGNFLPIASTEEGLWMHDFYSIYVLPDGGRHIIRKGRSDKHQINCGHMDRSGIIWLATEEGLCRFNIQTGGFSHVRTSLLKTAASVVCDMDSRVWIGTDMGLYAYLSDSGNFALFGRSDGADPNEYLSKPRLVSREGDVYMGGVQGLLCIDRDFAIDTSDEPRTSLYSLTVDNETIRPDGNVYDVPRHSNSMEVSVATQEKDIFREKVYRFTIPSAGMTHEGKSPTLEIQQFPKPGRHDIFVSCTRRNGEWSEPVRILTMRVPQPWYLSGWFLASVIVLAFLTAAAVHIAMTRRRNSRLQLALKEQEQKVHEEKVQFLINISHELRTPLTLIMAPLKRILNGMDAGDEHHSTLSRVYRQSRRMRDLLNMVLDLRKMEVGKNSLRIETSDFNRWILDSIEDIVNEEHAEGIDIITDFDPEVSMVDFDKRKCDTVLTNILMNAIKHSHKGDRITIKTDLTDEGMVRTSISDEGPGLRDIEPSKMFTRFYQSNSEEYGSGIGLSYSKILVELHSGRIGAENNEGKGATFWWEIPVRSVSGSMETPSKAFLNEVIGSMADIEVPECASFSTADTKIMLVDDNQDLIDFLKEALSPDFAEIMTASSGNMAMEILRSGKMPDIIVSDVNMPDGDGYSLCATLNNNAKYSHIPIVLLTARGEEQSQSDSYRVGADAFLAKPFEIETLLELLRGILRKKADIRHRYLDADDTASASYGSQEESFIIQLNRIIAEHMADPDLDQQLICRELGVSRASLFNRMKAITGAGTKEYITRIRLEKAKSLIETTDLTIAEIAEQTGFASQSYFSTAFKSYAGTSPSQYKKEKRG